MPVCTHLVAALRSFCRFLRYSGHTYANLVLCVTPVARWALADVPKHLSAEEVEKVLAACNPTTALGRRDYAILLRLARLGLRGGEVLGLNLEDIDWESGTITIPVTKNRRGARMPLPSDAGKAVAEYLRRDRPRCKCRRVFLRTKPPHAGLSASPVISMIAAKALRRAQVQSASTGPTSSAIALRRPCSDVERHLGRSDNSCATRIPRQPRSMRGLT